MDTGWIIAIVVAVVLVAAAIVIALMVRRANEQRELDRAEAGRIREHARAGESDVDALERVAREAQDRAARARRAAEDAEREAEEATTAAREARDRTTDEYLRADDVDPDQDDRRRHGRR